MTTCRAAHSLVILGFHRATRVVDPRRGARKPGDLVPGPRDFVAWLRSHPHLRVTKPVPVTALGLRGVRVDMEVRSAPDRIPDDCGKLTGTCPALLHDGFDRALYTSDSKARFLVLDQGGRQLVLDQWVLPRERFGALVWPAMVLGLIAPLYYGGFATYMFGGVWFAIVGVLLFRRRAQAWPGLRGRGRRRRARGAQRAAEMPQDRSVLRSARQFSPFVVIPAAQSSWWPGTKSGASIASM